MNKDDKYLIRVKKPKRQDCTVRLSPIAMCSRTKALHNLFEKIMDVKIHDPKTKDLLLKLYKLAKANGGGLKGGGL